MKIVLKTNNANQKNEEKPVERKKEKDSEANKGDESGKKAKSSLSLAFGKEDDASTEAPNKFEDKSTVSKGKEESSRVNNELFKGKKYSLKALEVGEEAKEQMDPELYLYDEFLPESANKERRKFKYLGYVEGENTSEGEEEVETQESRYMSKMVSTAQKRQMERDIAYEKQLLREELKNDSNVGEVFVTGAYKKKLEERKKFEEEQRKRDEFDEAHSKTNLTKFHTHLLNSNLARRSANN